MPLDTDLIILAEHTFEIAVGEKNGARPLFRSTRHCHGQRIQGDKRASACWIFSFSEPNCLVLTYLGIKGFIEQHPNYKSKFSNIPIFRKFQA